MAATSRASSIWRSPGDAGVVLVLLFGEPRFVGCGGVDGTGSGLEALGSDRFRLIGDGVEGTGSALASTALEERCFRPVGAFVARTDSPL